MMKATVFSKFVIALAVVATTLNARAEDRWSTQKWAHDFATSLKTKNATQTLQLLDFEKLDKQVLTFCDDCENKEKMAKARKLYSESKYDEAREIYGQISKKSPYWLQAIEEKAWTYFRQNQLENALAQTKTLLSPQFASYVGSESYFLQSLAQLKACNYKGVFETNQSFKEKQKTRLIEIQNLSKTGMNEAFQKVIASTESFPMRFSDVDESANRLPALFFKDIELQRQLMRYKLAEKALSILQSDLSGTSQKLQVSLEKIKSSSRTQLQSRMKQLASDETTDNFKIVQKLNLVEVEAVQRLHADVELDKKLFKKGDFNKTNAEQLVFVDDGRPWIDELDKYEVRTKACPQNIRRKM